MTAARENTALIDVHQHIVPTVFRRLLSSVGITGGAGEELADWDEQRTIDVMDENGIGTSIVSYVLSGIDITDVAFFRKLCRECNQYTAQLIAKYPSRFGAFALLPLPDIDGTLVEIAFALDHLNLDGVGMHSNMGGIYPGDKRLEPVLEELNRRKAVVHLHPTDIPEGRGLRPQWPPYIVEFMFETTRAVANLVYSGTMQRYPNISIILSHAGGAVPFLAWRMWTGEFTIPRFQEAVPAGVIESLKRFYYDTAMAANPASFAALTQLVEPDRILFGTDYPYMPDYAIGEFVRQIESFPGFDSAGRDSIKSSAASRLFPRLATNDERSRRG